MNYRDLSLLWLLFAICTSLGCGSMSEVSYLVLSFYEGHGQGLSPGELSFEKVGDFRRLAYVVRTKRHYF